MMPGDLRRYCKKKALAFVDTCLDHDELKKVQMCHGFKETLYNGYDDDDDPYAEDEDPCDKLMIHPIGDNKDQFDNDDGNYDGGECEKMHSFLSKSMVIGPLVAAKLLSAFTSDDTPAVCIQYDYDNRIAGWDEGYFYPTFILLVTDDLTVAYASMGFQYEWDDYSF
jgi:hypothetical protein